MANPSGLYFSSDPMASASSAPPPSSVPSSSLPPAFEGFPSAHMSLLELELHNERVNKLQSKVGVVFVFLVGYVGVISLGGFVWRVKNVRSEKLGVSWCGVVGGELTKNKIEISLANTIGRIGLDEIRKGDIFILL